MRISITLPSLFPESLYRTLDNLLRTTKEYKLQVIVVAPFEIGSGQFSSRHQLIWVKDIKQDGCNSAHNLASLHATGDFMFAWVDDHMFVGGWDVLALENFYRRENKWRSGPPKYASPFVLGLRQIQSGPDVGGRVGTIFGQYYPYFPLMRMDDVKRVGGWFSSTAYKHGFGDCDLALRVLQAGGICEWADTPTIKVGEDDSHHKGAINYQHDMECFIKQWKPLYGEKWDTTEVRGFNRDIFISSLPPGARSCAFDAYAMPQHGS